MHSRWPTCAQDPPKLCTNWSQYNLSTWMRRGLLLHFLSDAIVGSCQPPIYEFKMWSPKLRRHISEPQTLQLARVVTRVLATDVFFSDLHCVVVVVFSYIYIMCQVVVDGGVGGGGGGVCMCVCVVWYMCGVGGWVWVWHGNTWEKEKIGRAMNRKKGNIVPIAGFKPTILWSNCAEPCTTAHVLNGANRVATGWQNMIFSLSLSLYIYMMAN